MVPRGGKHPFEVNQSARLARPDGVLPGCPMTSATLAAFTRRHGGQAARPLMPEPELRHRMCRCRHPWPPASASRALHARVPGVGAWRVRRALLAVRGGPGLVWAFLRALGDEGREDTGEVFLEMLLVAFNLLAWAWAWSEFASRPALLATAFLAYLFGLRHAAAADHIAAIDNVVRKLMQEGKRPIAAGLFFSLGHSSLVVLATIGIAASTTALHAHFARWRLFGGIVGTSISGGFLLAIGAMNAAVLAGVRRNFRHVRRGGTISPERAELPGAAGGVLARALRALFRLIGRSWHMFGLGVLFGLGFDTASEIALLGLSAAQAAQGMSIPTMLVFPALFAAGMVLVDTADGVLMVRAYGWAFADPVRKLWYNLTITAISVLVAVAVGGAEVLGLIAGKPASEGGSPGRIAALGDRVPEQGFVVVSALLACWIASVLIYRWRFRGAPAASRERA